MNRLTEETPYAGIDLIQSVYNYGSDSLLSSMYQGILYFTYTYDHLNRITVENIELYDGNTVKNEYTYENGTTLVATRKFYINNVLTETLAYTYDKWGNIKTQSKDGVLQESYTYDELNQLKTVTKGSDVYEYTYDNGGNILNVKLNGVVTDTYTYGDENWKDKLTAYNGQTITYDSIGNPLTYRDGMTFSWQNGRRLSSLQQGENVVQYTYDDSGLRIAKNLNGTSTNFYYDDSGKLFRIGDGSGMFWLFYGTDGSAMSFKHRDIRYYYVKNQQGDITAIVDMFGNTVAKYSYDVWGKPLSITDGNGNDVSTNATHIANINPLRYRGYYYDAESGLYYLQSRYYDPEVGRFISADIPEALTVSFEDFVQYNLFAYCFNNPINMFDETGAWPKWIKKAFAVAATAVTVIAATAITVVTFGPGSVAGVAMLTATATFAAKTTEVAILQVKKGKAEGKSASQIAKDTIESVYDNGLKIIGPTSVTKFTGIAVNHYLSATVEKGFGGVQTWGKTLTSVQGKVMPVAFSTIAWIHTLVTASSDDPVARAELRGYVLK